MQGENRAGRNALREKEGSEKRASGQAGCGVPSLLSFLFPECPPYLGVLSPPRCGEWATSLARALYHHPTLRVSSLCVRRNALLVRVEARAEGQGNALCVSACVHFLAFVRSLFFSLWAKHRDEFV